MSCFHRSHGNNRILPCSFASKTVFNLSLVISLDLVSSGNIEWIDSRCRLSLLLQRLRVLSLCLDERSRCSIIKVISNKSRVEYRDRFLWISVLLLSAPRIIAVFLLVNIPSFVRIRSNLQGRELMRMRVSGAKDMVDDI